MMVDIVRRIICVTLFFFVNAIFNAINATEHVSASLVLVYWLVAVGWLAHLARHRRRHHSRFRPARLP